MTGPALPCTQAPGAPHGRRPARGGRRRRSAASTGVVGTGRSARGGSIGSPSGGRRLCASVLTGLIAAAALLLAGCSDGNGSLLAALQDVISTGPNGNVEVPTENDAVWEWTPDIQAPDAGSPSDAGPGDTGTAPSSVAISAVVPALGTTGGGEIVTITGAGFEPGATVLFGDSPGGYVFVEAPEQLLVMTPAHAAGRVDVRVEVPGGDAGVLESGYEFASPVHIDAVEPPSGPAAGGTPVEIIGGGFTPDAVLLIGGLPAIAPHVLGDDRIIAIAPPGPPGPADIHVTTSAGGGKLDAGYRYTSAPVVDTLDPWSGTALGGTALTIAGQALPADTEVWIEGQAATVFDPGDGHSVTVLTPGGPPGPADVLVATADGATLLPGAFTYVTATPELTVWNLWPHQGAQMGGETVTMTVTGLGSTEDVTVRFGSTPATVLSVAPEAATVVVRTPPFAAPGVVDVAVTAGAQEATLPDAFTILPLLDVTSITPAEGPDSGGTPVVVSGHGFAQGLELRVGPLPASAVQVVDGQTIKAVTPAGGAGYADLRVTQGDQQAVLKDGFRYTGEDGLVVHALEPTLGAMAGGTYVEIYGSGFVPGAQVLFGDTPAASVTVVSPVVIAAYSPPGIVQTVDIAVSTPAATRVLAGAWTWYNPLSDKGGTWGGPIDGSVNVTVLDGMTGEPVGGAVVVLGEGKDAWVRIADENGQTTFSKKGLLGPVQISASKGEPPAKYSAYSIVTYDAKNATIYLIPEIPPTPGGGGGEDIPSQVSGRVFGMDKYILPPPGDCAAKVAAGEPSAYCAPCEDTATCEAIGQGPGWECAALLQPGWTLGSFCTTACAVDADCKDGYVCAASDAGSWCHPAPPVRAAYCMPSKENHFGYQPLFDESQRVDAEGNYSMTTRVGVLAVACWGGWIDESGTFTPSILGVRRNVVTLSGALVDGQDVTLEIPVSHSLRARFVDAPVHPAGLTAPYFKISLELDGEDGYLQVPEAALDPMGPLFEFPGYPDRLVGPLFGARYHLYASVYAATQTGMPYGVVFLQGLEDVVGEGVLVRGASDTDGADDVVGWAAPGQELRRDLEAVWGVDDDTIWAVGPGGLIVRGGATGWWPQGAIVKSDLHAVWGTGPADVWAVGAGGVALHFDGLGWQQVATGTTSELRGVWGTGPTDVYAVGDDGVLRWDGVGWSPVPMSHAGDLTSVSGDGATVWAVGSDGKVVERSGSSWVSSFVAPGRALHGVWAGGGVVVAVGDEGTIRVRKSGVWSDQSAPTTATLRGVWGRSASDVLVVGDAGTILRWDGTAWHDETELDAGVDLRAVWAPETGPMAAAVGRFNVLVGPFMPFPVITTPAEGGPLSDFRVAWDLPTSSVSISGVTMTDEMGSPFWQMIVEGGDDHVDLPDFGALQSLDVIPKGAIRVTVSHIRFRPDTVFDIDAYISQDLSIYRRSTWAVSQVLSY